MEIINNREYYMGVDPGHGRDIKVASLFKRGEDGRMEFIRNIRETSLKKFEKKVKELKTKYSLNENNSNGTNS